MPTEGLYAEALRRPGLFESLQRDHRVMLAGPTTLLAVLTSLQIGFRTLALEQRSNEVCEMLSVVKTEFGKFGDVLANDQAEADEVDNSIGRGGDANAGDGARAEAVEAAPELRAQTLLPGGRSTTPIPTTTLKTSTAAAIHPRLLALIGGQIALHSCMAGIRMAAPLAALREGHAAWAVGVLLGLFAAAPVALALAAGRLADRHGYHVPIRVAVAPDRRRRHLRGDRDAGADRPVRRPLRRRRCSPAPARTSA